MKSFVQAYANRFNEILTEKGVFDMRHAVKITFMNGVKMVCMTPLMKLLIRIGSLLKHETYLNICEIKTALDLSLPFCFEMGVFCNILTPVTLLINIIFFSGYPNLSSLIQAHMDLFASPSGNNVHERSDIRLHQDSILTQKGFHKFIDQCKQYLGNINKRPTGVEHLQPKALPYVGNQLRQTPGAKPRNLAPSDQTLYFHTAPPTRSTTPRSTFFADNQRYATVGGFKPDFSKYSMSYDRQNIENYQLDLNNNSVGNDWFAKSVSRPPPGYLPKSSIATSHSATQQSQAPTVHDRRNSSDITSLSNLSDMFGLSSMQSGGVTGGFDTFPSFNFSSYYEPPKPDTPPARTVPFNYDPVWSNNTNGAYEAGQGFGSGNANNMHSVRHYLIFLLLGFN